jgi:hypothetical protein
MERHRHALVESPGFQLRRAADWPITSCLISENWTEPAVLIQIILTRARADAPADAPLAVGVYLVDPACLGLKNTYGMLMAAWKRREMIEQIGSTAVLVEVEPGIAAGIIRGAIDYAAGLGFPPQADFEDTHHLVANIPPADVSGHLHLGGEDGKPLYIIGPEDDAEAIVRKLTAKLGPDGFNYMMGI